jgi:hypothetical protein
MTPAESVDRIVAALESIAVSLDAAKRDRWVRQEVVAALEQAAESRWCEDYPHCNCYGCAARRALEALGRV